MYDAAKNELCLSPLAKDLMKDNPGLVNYRVEIRVGGKQTFLDQIAILHFETQHSYDVRAFYESAVKRTNAVVLPVKLAASSSKVIFR